MKEQTKKEGKGVFHNFYPYIHTQIFIILHHEHSHTLNIPWNLFKNYLFIQLNITFLFLFA